jgi:protein-L-isoaspartate(D-aspartate) O-methyltransferase
MNTDTRDTAARFHADLVDLLLARGTVRSGRVEAALRAVPRHPFVPDVSLETAYTPDDAVVTKRDNAGAALSSASAPGVVASMLEQLDVQPGDRILEIGAGTGYNAALLAELAGPTGRVVTLDIDADVVDAARAALASTGYGQVEVRCADGAEGHPPTAPYDRVIVTGGTTRSIAFDRHNDHLVSRSMVTCGFLAMRGIGSPPEPVAVLADGVTLLLGDGRPAPPDTLAHALTLPALRSWSGIMIRSGRPFQDLDLWLAITSRGFCRIVAQPRAVETDLATPAFRWGGAAMTNETDSLAYLTIRPSEPADDGPVFELGVRAHGPHRDELTASLLARIECWDSQHRETTPLITAHVKPSQVTAATIIDKPDTLLAVTWCA